MDGELRLSLPDRLDHNPSTRDFVRDLLDARTDSRRVVIEPNTVGFSCPFGTLLVASAIRQMVSARKDRALATQCVKKGFGAGPSYLGHIGFFDLMGFKWGKPKNSPASKTHIPIQVLKRDDLGFNFQDRVEEESEKLARVVCRSMKEPSHAEPVLSYAFREVIRNVFEHANTDECLLMVQTWRDGRTVEIAIQDAGCGVFTSLAPKYPDRCLHSDGASATWYSNR